jgi:hypothetical protein
LISKEFAAEGTEGIEGSQGVEGLQQSEKQIAALISARNDKKTPRSLYLNGKTE